MARISEDSDSWKASGTIRRDFRSSKEDPEVNRHMGNKKKNTKKWCRGKTGQVHDIKHQEHPTYGKYGTHIDLCMRCGKEIKSYWAGWLYTTRRKRCEGCPK